MTDPTHPHCPLRPPRARVAASFASPTRRAGSARRPPDQPRHGAPAVGERVLIIDLDPRATRPTGGSASNPPAAAIQPTTSSAARRSCGARGAPDRSAALFLAPSTIDLSGFESRSEVADRAFRLRIALARCARRAREVVSHVLVDCPRRSNLLTINAMAAANAILVPLAMRVLCARRSVAAPQDRERSAELNPGLSIQASLTMFDARTISPPGRGGRAPSSWHKVYDT